MGEPSEISESAPARWAWQPLWRVEGEGRCKRAAGSADQRGLGMGKRWELKGGGGSGPSAPDPSHGLQASSSLPCSHLLAFANHLLGLLPSCLT